MTLYCIIAIILSTALALVLMYALCVAAANGDAMNDRLAEQARRQSEGKVRG